MTLSSCESSSVGATDKSYGIHVARLAGIPKKVTDRASGILNESMNRDVPSGTRPQRYTQILLVDNENPPQTPLHDPVLDHLARINTDGMTPLQALTKIVELQQMLKNKEIPS